MRIVVGSDHAGFALKQQIAEALRSEGHEVLDVGAYGAEASDYPDFAEAVGLAVRDGRAERGVLVCGSGVGASVSANKLPGIRAAVCHDTYSAHQGVEHDDLNVRLLGRRVVGDIWLTTWWAPSSGPASRARSGTRAVWRRSRRSKRSTGSRERVARRVNRGDPQPDPASCEVLHSSRDADGVSLFERARLSSGGGRFDGRGVAFGGAGRGSQNSLPLEFGLGTAERVLSVTVRWPSGLVPERRDLGVNQEMTVGEGR